MTRDKFNATRYTPDMEVDYKSSGAKESKPYPITAINFDEGLFELLGSDDNYFWVRCESVDLVK